MEKKDVRIPQQKRSIEKKEKIVEAANKIFMTNGYFNTNTADIAKAAGISTGSVYAYFEDKKDILLLCLNRFGEALTEKICTNIENLNVTGDAEAVIKNILKIFVSNNDWTKLLRDEILSLKYKDEDVKKYFQKIQKTMMEAVTNQLEVCGYTFSNKNEQTFLLFQMIMSIVDELAFEHNPEINKEILIGQCAKAILPLLTKE